jgi:hypothetical protein
MACCLVGVSLGLVVKSAGNRGMVFRPKLRAQARNLLIAIDVLLGVSLAAPTGLQIHLNSAQGELLASLRAASMEF